MLTAKVRVKVKVRVRAVRASSPPQYVIPPSLPSSALQTLGKHAAMLGVEVGGVVSNRWGVVQGTVGGWRTHSVTMWRMRSPKEGSKATTSWQQVRGWTTTWDSCHLREREECRNVQGRQQDENRLLLWSRFFLSASLQVPVSVCVCSDGTHLRVE